jgi:hypothetical protein
MRHLYVLPSCIDSLVGVLPHGHGLSFAIMVYANLTAQAPQKSAF